MGAGVSAGENNDDLIDNLIEANYIKTPLVERVFRAVDRGAYFLQQPPTDAYRDVAWKNGNFHISAPCIYSEVMEGLKLKPGLSFLNLGSGTGYLNTIAGLILGSYGINHGIELHEDVIQYAYMRLEEFKKHSGAVDEFDFCEPKFMQGNCLCLVSSFHLYDRVYCGAACPEKYLPYLKSLLKVGGILVVPISERLVEMRRISETSWSTHYLLPVSFTNLVKPEQGTQESVPCFEIEPLTLQELCRTTVRNLLRKNIEVEYPNVKNIKKTRKTSKKKKPMKRDRNGRKDNPRASEELLDFFLLTIARKKKRINLANVRDTENSSSSANNDDTDEESSDSDDSSLHSTLETMQETFNVLDTRDNESNFSLNYNLPDSNMEKAGSSTQRDVDQYENSVIVHRADCQDENVNQDVSYNVTVKPLVLTVPENMTEEDSTEDKIKNNRNKLDSGLGDELLISELQGDLVEPATSSSDEDIENKRVKRGLKDKDRRLNSKWRKIERIDALKQHGEDSTDNEDRFDSENEYMEAMRRMKMYMSPYTTHMKNKIQQLPLPANVKKFLNFYREF